MSPRGVRSTGGISLPGARAGEPDGHPDRLTRPLKRVGARGRGRFEAVSWDRALDEIADKLKAVRERHGAKALAIHMGTRTGVLNILGHMRLSARHWGTSNVATTEPFCDARKVIALELTRGGLDPASQQSNLKLRLCRFSAV